MQGLQVSQSGVYVFKTYLKLILFTNLMYHAPSQSRCISSINNLNKQEQLILEWKVYSLH